MSHHKQNAHFQHAQHSLVDDDSPGIMIYDESFQLTYDFKWKTEEHERKPNEDAIERHYKITRCNIALESVISRGFP